LQHLFLQDRNMQKGIKSLLARAVLHYIRNWDARSANGVDVFLTNSDQVARRIEKFYRRRSTTLYPPVDVEHFSLQTHKEDYYLAVSNSAWGERMDLIIEAFGKMPEKRLIVVGDGPELNRLKANLPKNVKLVGAQPMDRVVDYMRFARAFVLANEEDFGIL